MNSLVRGLFPYSRGLLAELASGVGQRSVGTVIARRGSCRFFLVTASDGHHERLATSLDQFAARWFRHADLVR